MSIENKILMLEVTKQSIAVEYVLTAGREGEADSSIKAKKNQPTLHKTKNLDNKEYPERDTCGSK